jgi:hypothetical protein
MSEVRYARLRCAEAVTKFRQHAGGVRTAALLYFCASAIVFSGASLAFAHSTEQPWIHDRYINGDFILVRGGAVADQLVSTNDFKVVRIGPGWFEAELSGAE